VMNSIVCISGRGCRGHERMVSSNHTETICTRYNFKFVSDLREAGGFLRVFTIST
jgi:hypothetical protein